MSGGGVGDLGGEQRSNREERGAVEAGLAEGWCFPPVDPTSAARRARTGAATATAGPRAANDERAPPF